MAHFAEISDDNIVKRVVVIPDSQESRGEEYLRDEIGLGGRWIQTSYNGNIRMRFAGIGFYYNELRDAFVAPKPFSSWILNDVTLEWNAPIPYPNDGKTYVWDESAIQWVEAPNV